MMNYVVEWLNNQKMLALILFEELSRGFHHHKPHTRYKQYSDAVQ